MNIFLQRSEFAESKGDIMTETIISNAIAYVERLFRDNADGHGADHTMRVYRNAMRLAEAYPEADRLLIALASLLHDADDHKLFHTENNANARFFLNENNISADLADRICEIINAVSFSKNRDKAPQTVEGMIVQDADRLDAIGAIGIARTFAFGGMHRRTITSSIDHFHEKLLLLKDMMNTPEAKKIAEKRHGFMLQFLKQYEEETNI